MIRLQNTKYDHLKATYAKTMINGRTHIIAKLLKPDDAKL